MMQEGRAFLFRTLCVVLFVPSLLAQWSSNAATNSSIADQTSEQVQPKIAPTSDGGCYISWFDNAAGGYDVRLQRLDADGVEQWAHNGLLIADRGFSSTQDYGLDVDTAGNALLTFRDDRFTGTQITATKVDASGNQVWGATGVQLTSTTDFVAAPKIAGTSDGNAVVAWTQTNDAYLQKLDGSGAPLWGAGVILIEPMADNYSASDLHDSDSGSAILSFIRDSGFSSPRHLLAQKLDASGNLLWGAAHVAVFDGGSLQFGNFPRFTTDGSGGAVFSWYSSSPSLQCFAQRLDASGSEVFAHNGVALSTNATRVRVSPSAAFNPTTAEVFAFWTEENSLQSMHGVYGQKLDAAGNRQWGSDGATLVSVGSTETIWVRTLISGDGAFVFWIASTGFGMSTLNASLVDSTGAFSVAPFLAASTVSGKTRLDAAMSTHAYALLAWMDDRNDPNDILAQNVHCDGALGPFGATSYCTGKTNSLGCVPFMTFSGVASETSTGPFRIEGNDVLPTQVGLLLYSAQKTSLAFHGGTLCVKAPFKRLLPPKTPSATGSPPCTGVLIRNFNNTIQSGTDPILTAGQTIFAQWRQRDPSDPAGFGDGLSNGLRFTICP